MNARATALLEQAKALPVEEREALVAALQATLDSPDAAWEAAWEAAWVRECEDRIAAVERGEMAVVDADAVMAELRRKFKR
jgi:hypothetical protein